MRRRARGRQSGGIATCGMWCASHSGRRFCPQCCLWSRRFSRPRALSTPFSGRLALLRLCAMTLILPVLVAVFGILSVYGRQGWLASLWQMLGLQWTFSPTACRAFYWRTSFLTCQWRAVCCCNLWKAFPASSASSPPSSVCAAGIFSVLSNGRGCAAKFRLSRR